MLVIFNRFVRTLTGRVFQRENRSGRVRVFNKVYCEEEETRMNMALDGAPVDS